MRYCPAERRTPRRRAQVLSSMTYPLAMRELLHSAAPDRLNVDSCQRAPHRNRNRNLAESAPEQSMPVTHAEPSRSWRSPHISCFAFGVTLQRGLYGAANRLTTGKVLVRGT